MPLGGGQNAVKYTDFYRAGAQNAVKYTVFYRSGRPRQSVTCHREGAESMQNTRDYIEAAGRNAVKYTVFYRAGGLAAENDLPLGGDYPAAEGDLRQFLTLGKNPLFRRLHIWGKIDRILLNYPHYPY